MTALAMGLVPMMGQAADPLSNLPFNLAGGAPNLDIRLRYENVDQENLKEEADALTIRTRLGYTTGKWNEIDGQIEYEGLSFLGDDDYNSFANGNATFPVVADAKTNELNQAWIRYSGLPKTQLKYGRQRILLDNHRFVGNVGWRQTEMTYDAGLLTSTLIPRTTFTYAYLSNVNSFRFFDFNPDPMAVTLDDNIDIKAHLVNAQFAAIEKKLVLTAYGYLLDFDEIPAGAPAGRLFQDTSTIGLRATGAVPVAKLTASYALEYADQQDYEDAPSTINFTYSLIEAGLAYAKLKGTLGYETLEGDGTNSFQTPLATAHAHQGWADQFLITPQGGLVRSYASVNATVGKLGLTAVYHQFESDEGSVDFGDEIDLLASFTVIENLVLSAKYAAYSADEFPKTSPPPPPAVPPATPPPPFVPKTFDTDKLWLYVEYKF
ncbi:MAG: alginate export family protein [Panacagrimonas sp.]